MRVVCLDLEGVLVPEVWLGVADETKLDGLRLTTRDMPDYAELMAHRLKILDENDIGIDLIQNVISTLQPLPGAKEFLDRLRGEAQVIILSDTFYEFATPLMEHLDRPTIFCHYLDVQDGRISGYRLRTDDHKTKTVNALKELNFTVAAAGDSYNDVGMIQAAHVSSFFCAPDRVLADFPDVAHTQDYDLLADYLLNTPAGA